MSDTTNAPTPARVPRVSVRRSPGNPHAIASADFWRYEIDVRLRAFAAELRPESPHWLSPTVCQWDDHPERYWHDVKGASLGPIGDRPGFFATLDATLESIAKRLDVDSEGGSFRVTVGWLIHSGFLTIGLRLRY